MQLLRTEGELSLLCGDRGGAKTHPLCISHVLSIKVDKMCMN